MPAFVVHRCCIESPENRGDCREYSAAKAIFQREWMTGGKADFRFSSQFASGESEAGTSVRAYDQLSRCSIFQSGLSFALSVARIAKKRYSG